MKRAVGFVCLVMALVPTACVTTPGGLTSSTLPITSRDAYTVIGPAQASDWGIGIGGLSLIPYSAYDALQKAKASAGADGLVNVTCDNKQYWLTVVYPLLTLNTVTVRGDAIKFKRGIGTEF